MTDDFNNMHEDRTIAVITTIQPPTRSVDELLGHLRPHQIPLVVIGDAKGPHHYDRVDVDFYDLQRQLSLPLPLAPRLPQGHYTRKNLGYLLAMMQGATCIYETDDDNAPLASWQPRSQVVPARALSEPGWANAYAYFGIKDIWPRGFALEHIAASRSGEMGLLAPPQSVLAPIQQGLANGSPDVDAIWRLTQDRPVVFSAGESVAVGRGSWCPFNSQSTWWWPVAFPLLYLPSHCTFRMTDIWRSFIAQRCLWELELPVVFHAPEVYQERNQHDLLRDFKDEIPGYMRNSELTKVLAGLRLQSGPENITANLGHCYQALVTEGFFPAVELGLLACWFHSLQEVLTNQRR